MVESGLRRALIVGSLLVGAVVIVAQSITHLIVTVTLGACDETGFASCHSYLDLDRSNGVWDIVSTIVIGAAAAGAMVLGWRRRPLELSSLVLAAALLLITFDDTLHIEDSINSPSGMVVLVTLVIAAFLTIRVAAVTPGTARWLLLLGMALLALDTKMPFLYDQLMNTVGQPALGRGDVLYELGVVLDEAMELAGWILIAVGLWDAATARDSRFEAREVRPELLEDGSGVGLRD